MALRTLDELTPEDLKDKRVLVRFDFNVPLDKSDHTRITDTTRIDACLPTIRYLLEGGVKKLILMSHLGRPKGQRSEKESLEPVATYLAEKLNEEVLLTESALDRGIKTLFGLSTNRVILLENLRFHPEEEKNDPEFSRTLASYCDLYINDAFGTAHRKHASTYGVIAHLRKGQYFAGFLLQKEIEGLQRVVDRPAHPFVALMGGAKVSDKIKVIEALLFNVDQLLIGGAMAYPFLKAQGHSVGKSLCSDDDVTLAAKLLKSKHGPKIQLPIDHLAATSPDADAVVIGERALPDELAGFDIGPATIEHYTSLLSSAKTILWNGPMGFFEKPAFAQGSFKMARALAESSAFTVVGGGDSVSAINQSGLSDKISHVSTGGGASLEFIENGTLPGIQALRFGVNS
jgi:phosphoglycerate kinase